MFIIRMLLARQSVLLLAGICFLGFSSSVFSETDSTNQFTSSNLLDSLSAEAVATDINPDSQLQTPSVAEPAVRPGDDHNVAEIVDKISNRLSKLSDLDDKTEVMKAIKNVDGIESLQIDIASIVKQAMLEVKSADETKPEEKTVKVEDIAKIVSEAMAGSVASEVEGNVCPINSTMEKAIKEQDIDYLQACLDKGMKVDQASDNGWTMMHYAAQMGKEKVINFLAENNANVNAIDQYRRTPLFVAVGYRQADVVKLLIKKDADIHQRDRFGVKPYYRATKIELRNLLAEK